MIFVQFISRILILLMLSFEQPYSFMYTGTGSVNIGHNLNLPISHVLKKIPSHLSFRQEYVGLIHCRAHVHWHVTSKFETWTQFVLLIICGECQWLCFCTMVYMYLWLVAMYACIPYLLLDCPKNVVRKQCVFQMVFVKSDVALDRTPSSFFKHRNSTFIDVLKICLVRYKSNSVDSLCDTES